MDDVITEIYSYSRTFAAVGMLIVASYAGMKYMKASDPMERKDAMETVIYAIMGAMMVLLAPMISEVLVP